MPGINVAGRKDSEEPASPCCATVLRGHGDAFQAVESSGQPLVSPEEAQLMEISEQLLCLFSAQVEQRDGSYVVEIPEQELRLGGIDGGSTYRVAVSLTPTESQEETERKSEEEHGRSEPPVVEGETREVEIEDLGEQGDGITRVERGYVVIVPETEKGERVRIAISDVRENVAFADVVERLSYYE